MRSRCSLFSIALFLAACGGSSKPPADAGKTATGPKGQVHTCGEKDKVHQHELDQNAPGETTAFVPCSGSGAGDYSGEVKIESEPDGIHIHIEATDDEFKEGIPGTLNDVKDRDAVLVYPKGNSTKAVEVPLKRKPGGYVGDKVIPYDELEKLTDDGTKLEVAIFDHDESAKSTEELHVAVAVSTGKSCEKAIDENPQSLDMGKGAGKSKPDLTDDQLGGPMKTSAFFASCGLKDSENAEICVAVKQGKPLGVSVNVSPNDKRVAACIDRATRKLHWPASDKLDVVRQKF